MGASSQVMTEVFPIKEILPQPPIMEIFPKGSTNVEGKKRREAIGTFLKEKLGISWQQEISDNFQNQSIDQYNDHTLGDGSEEVRDMEIEVNELYQATQESGYNQAKFL